MEKYFSFYGCASRLEYWGVQIVFFIGTAVAYTVFFSSYLSVTDFSIIESIEFIIIGSVEFYIRFIIILSLVSWVWLAVIARRLRDAGINPWWMLLLLVPFVALIAWIYWGCIRSKK